MTTASSRASLSFLLPKRCLSPSQLRQSSPAWILFVLLVISACLWRGWSGRLAVARLAYSPNLHEHGIADSGAPRHDRKHDCRVRAELHALSHASLTECPRCYAVADGRLFEPSLITRTGTAASLYSGLRIIMDIFRLNASA